MKKTLRSIVALGSLFPVIAFAQAVPVPPSPPSPATPPSPPAVVTPPAPPEPPQPAPDRQRSGGFLGVEVSRVSSVLGEQLNLPEGFGVLVEYVVPGSPAEAAGVKAHDILKLVNDQIITGSEQLSVLVRSFADGQAVALVVLHKGQETKLTATLRRRNPREADRDEEKRSHRRQAERGEDRDERDWSDFNGFPNAEYTDQLQKQLARSRAQVQAQTARALEQAKRDLQEAQERTARAAGSRWDFDRARVVLHDASGRIELRIAHGRRSLKVRDPQGKTVFEGPIDTPEQRKAIPADVLPQVEALEREREAVFPKENDSDEDREGNF